MAPQWPEHAVTAAVALGVAGLAIAHGGYYPRAVGIATVAIWWIALVPLALGLWPRSAVPRQALAAGGLLAGLALLTGLSLAWSGDDGRGFTELVRAAGYLGVFVAVTAACRRGRARPWITGLAVGTTAVVLLALASRLEPGLLDESSAGEIARSLAAAQGRLSFPVGYWNALAGVCAIAFALLVWHGAGAGGRATRALAIGLAPLAPLAIFFTSSRGGYAAAGLALLTLLAAGPDRARLAFAGALAGGSSAILTALAAQRDALVDGVAPAVAAGQGDEMVVACLIAVVATSAVAFACDGVLGRLRPVRVPRPPAAAIAVAAVAVVVVAVVAVDPAERLDRFRELPAPQGESTGGGHLSSGSGSGRWQYWSAAVDAFEEEPVLGLGAGEFESFWAMHGELAVPLRNAHSLALETLAELGPAGLVVLAAFLVLVAATGVSRVRARGPGAGAALAVFVAGAGQALVDWTWELPAAFACTVAAAALLTGPATLPGVATATRPARRSRFGWGVATLLTGFAAIWAAGVLLLSETKLHDSRAAARSGELAQAASDAADAATLEPWAAAPKLQLALVRERQGRIAAARATLTEAIERSPGDWRLWVVAARLEVGLGRVTAAREALDEARRLNPKAPFLDG